jgi:putative cardiolipin synthase
MAARLLSCVKLARLTIDRIRIVVTSRDRFRRLRENSRLGRWLAAQAEYGQGKSGLRLLNTGADAFVARVGLIELADRSLDLQYYIFRHDSSSTIIIERLIAAAERGVVVRILLDDFGTVGRSHAAIDALDAHPNIEVRIFNPYAVPGKVRGKLRDMRGRFFRVNRRMHNKMLISDGSAVVIGGRNIGNEYFGLAAMNFQDLDVLGLGTVAADSVSSFESYWNSDFAVPVVLFHNHRESRQVALNARDGRMFGTPDREIYNKVLRESELARDLANHQARLCWANVRLLSDPPDKLADPLETVGEQYLGTQLTRHAAEATSELLISSPYLVPGREGLDFLGGRSKAGVAVSILTNSLAATDAWLVHAGYRKYRKSLLRRGIRLLELKPSAKGDAGVKGLIGSTRSSLHTKTLVFDRTSVFIGSLNIDPRSIRQNTECGVLVQHPQLAREVATLFDEWTSPRDAWELRLEESRGRQRLCWVGSEHGERGSQVTLYREPGATWLKDVAARVLSLFPIESQI